MDPLTSPSPSRLRLEKRRLGGKHTIGEKIEDIGLAVALDLEAIVGMAVRRDQGLLMELVFKIVQVVIFLSDRDDGEGAGRRLTIAGADRSQQGDHDLVLLTGSPFIAEIVTGDFAHHMARD